jgi:hypothetical protein
MMRDLTLEQAADIVAARVSTVKRADWKEDIGALLGRGVSAAKDYAGQIDPSNLLHAALIGGGLGAVGGAGSSLLSSDKEKRKRWLQNALFGGTVGGIGGGALSALAGQLGPEGALWKPDDTETGAADTPQPNTAQEALSHAWDASGIPAGLEWGKDKLQAAFKRAVPPGTPGAAGAAGTAGTAGASGGVGAVLSPLISGPGALGTGAAAGFGIDKALNNAAINKGQKADLGAAMTDPKFKGVVGGANKLRESSGRAPISDTQLGNLDADLNKTFLERLGFGKKPAPAPAPAPTPAPSPVQALSPAIPRSQPPAAKPVVPPTAPKAPPLQGEPLRALKNIAVQHQGAKSVTPKRRSGVRGAVLGAGAGFLSNALGAPELSPNQRAQQSGQPRIQ